MCALAVDSRLPHLHRTFQFCSFRIATSFLLKAIKIFYLSGCMLCIENNGTLRAWSAARSKRSHHRARKLDRHVKAGRNKYQRYECAILQLSNPC